MVFDGALQEHGGRVDSVGLGGAVVDHQQVASGVETLFVEEGQEGSVLLVAGQEGTCDQGRLVGLAEVDL